MEQDHERGIMPIRVLTKELVLDIIESYGQVTKLNLSTNGKRHFIDDWSVMKLTIPY